MKGMKTIYVKIKKTNAEHKNEIWETQISEEEKKENKRQIATKKVNDQDKVNESTSLLILNHDIDIIILNDDIAIWKLGIQSLVD